jgi:hypothetical protein
VRLYSFCGEIAGAGDDAFPRHQPRVHAGRDVSACDQHVCFEDNVLADLGDVVKVADAELVGKDPDDLFFS